MRVGSFMMAGVLAAVFVGCGEPTTFAEICKADIGSIKHFKGEFKVLVRKDYTYSRATEQIEEDGVGVLIVDKDVKVDMEKFNAKEIDGYTAVKASLPAGTPYYYDEGSYNPMKDKTEAIITIETLSPKCDKNSGWMSFDRKNTNIIWPK